MTRNIVHKSVWNNFDDIFSIQFSNENHRQVHSTRIDRIWNARLSLVLPHLLREMIVSLLFLLLKITRTWMIGFVHFDLEDETKNNERCSMELIGKCWWKFFLWLSNFIFRKILIFGKFEFFFGHSLFYWSRITSNQILSVYLLLRLKIFLSFIHENGNR